MSGLALKFAARELRSGVRGFGIFLACLALGVAARCDPCVQTLVKLGATRQELDETLAASAKPAQPEPAPSTTPPPTRSLSPPTHPHPT